MNKNDTRAPAVHAIVPAAGHGVRMQEQIPKQYLPLRGKPVVEWTLQRLLAVPGMRSVVVVLADDDDGWASVPSRNNGRIVTTVGGDTRADSVLAGLAKLLEISKGDPLVVVHDAARPCIRVSDVVRLIEQTASGVHGGLLARPVADTLKRADDADRVSATIDRSSVWSAATPQLFRSVELRDALVDAAQQGIVVTDEASAMEHAGFQPQLVACHQDNIKITTPGDLELAGVYLDLQQRS